MARVGVRIARIGVNIARIGVNIARIGVKLARIGVNTALNPASVRVSVAKLSLFRSFLESPPSRAFPMIFTTIQRAE